MQAHPSTITTARTLNPVAILTFLAVVAVVALGVILATQTGSSAQTVTNLGPTDAGSTASVEVGEGITITLPANPSTGYSWVVTSTTPALLNQVGEPEFSAESELIGAGGNIIFHFEGLATGQVSLQLDYLRPWEDAQPIDTFGVTINVR